MKGEDYTYKSDIFRFFNHGIVYIRIGAILLILISEWVLRDTLAAALASYNFYLHLSIRLVLTLVCVEWIYFVSRLLDSVYDWQSGGLIRIILQTILGIVCPVVVQLLVTLLWLMSKGLTFDEVEFLQNAFVLNTAFIILVNSFFLVRNIYMYSQKSLLVVEGATSDFGVNTSPVLEVYFGGEIKTYPQSEISYIYRLNGYNYIKIAPDGATYILSRSLGDLEEELDETMFFRINRQLIANRNCIQNVTPHVFGKIKVVVSKDCPFGKDVIVSQRRAQAFREWWGRVNPHPNT